MGIIPPAAAGSLGDQAMVDSAAGYVTNDLGRGVVIGPKPASIRARAEQVDGSGTLAEMRLMTRMLLGCSAIGCIGADILDGVYGAGQVLKRVRMLRAAHLLGRKTRVFGASWSEAPADRVAAALRAATWLEICARDPISQRRMETTLDRPVRLTADLAFLLKPELTSEPARRAADWIATRRQAGDVVMGVNLSGHTVRTLPGDGVQICAGPIIRWLDTDPGRSLLLMPHDRRGGMVGDGIVLERLRNILSDRFSARLHSLPTTLDTWELKALAGKVDLILTGRMHLAIAALGMATPALCMVYQGKFEGLMQLFGLEDMTLAPAAMDSAQSDAQLARITARRAELGGLIKDRLPQVLDLSRSNFDGM